jgi:hypothetical protein
MSNPTLEQVKTKHQIAIQLLDEFESTIPHLDQISKEFAPTAVKILRDTCNIVVTNVFASPSTAMTNLQSILAEKTGIASIDSVMEAYHHETNAVNKEFDKKDLISADTRLDKLISDIKELKQKYH